MVLNTPNEVQVNHFPSLVLASKKKKQVRFAYDPTGLRTPRSANLEAFQVELAKHLPDHLPQPVWASQANEIAAECERKGIPHRIGREYKPKTISYSYNQLKW